MTSGGREGSVRGSGNGSCGDGGSGKSRGREGFSHLPLVREVSGSGVGRGRRGGFGSGSEDSW